MDQRMDAWLSAAASILLSEGKTDAANLLTEVRDARLIERHTEERHSHDVSLLAGVTFSLLHRFTDDMKTQIRDAANQIEGPSINDVVAHPCVSESDWRSEIRAAVNARSINQRAFVDPSQANQCQVCHPHARGLLVPALDWAASSLASAVHSLSLSEDGRRPH